MDDATWLALTVTLTVVGAVGTWLAYRRRGVAAGMLGLGITLLFPAAYLTRTLRMLTEIVDAVAGWATSLVLSPTVWVGVVLAGLGVLLIGGSRALAARGAGARSGGPRGDGAVARGGRTRGEVGPAPARGAQAGADDDLADIEALLKRRGIS